MAKVTLRNMNDLHRKDYILGQTLDDVVTHLSTHKSDIETLKAQIAALQAQLTKK